MHQFKGPDNQKRTTFQQSGCGIRCQQALQEPQNHRKAYAAPHILLLGVQMLQRCLNGIQVILHLLQLRIPLVLAFVCFVHLLLQVFDALHQV